jgi:hypothetical protein
LSAAGGAGVWGGAATLDACGECGGDGTRCVDCAGAVGGAALVDRCGACDAERGNDCVQDCTAVWGGASAFLLVANARCGAAPWAPRRVAKLPKTRLDLPLPRQR